MAATIIFAMGINDTYWEVMLWPGGSDGEVGAGVGDVAGEEASAGDAAGEEAGAEVGAEVGVAQDGAP